MVRKLRSRPAKACKVELPSKKLPSKKPESREKLLRCPFCGSKADATAGDFGHSRLMYPSVFCSGCEATIGIEVETASEHEALVAIIAAWNRRVL